MRLPALLSCPLLVFAWLLSPALAVEDGYTEQLELQPLPGHHLHAQFTFTSSISKSAYDAHHFRHFPRSLAQILQQTHTAELHLRFALGRWDDEKWGARPRNGTREGGTGVELWAWIKGHDRAQAEERWSALVNGLSGQFCASLNFIDSTRTTQPLLAFEPEGNHISNDSLHIMHGLLPREVICTENLTPFLKMLPCKGKAGVSSLLDGHKLFDASWQTMSIDVVPRCDAAMNCLLGIEQGISMALSLPRSIRDRHDPIPRPVPIEEIECDQSKSYNAHDTCYPKAFDGQMAWNLTKVFGRPVQGKCAVDGNAETSSTVSLASSADQKLEVISAGSVSRLPVGSTQVFKITTEHEFDLNVSSQDTTASFDLPAPPVFVSRQLTGYGQQQGSIHAIIRNPHDFAQAVIWFESVPWYLRPFIHTLSVTGGTIEKMYYTPLIDRKRGSQLELLLHISARSTLVLEYEVEKAILRYTEYPPDANRGFDIGPAIIRVLPKESSSTAAGTNQGQYLRTTSLLLPLPTPDFSMPYNVIILTSTVIALGFGSIFNLLVRRFVLVEEVPTSPLVARIQGVVQVIRQKLQKRKPGLRSSESDQLATSHAHDSHVYSSVAVGSTNGDLKKRKAH